MSRDHLFLLLIEYFLHLCDSLLLLDPQQVVSGLRDGFGVDLAG